MKAGAGLVLTNDPTEAARRAVAQASEALGGDPAQLAGLFASSHFLSHAHALVARVAVDAGFPPLMGCVAEAVLGQGREIESQPAVSVWLASGLGAVEPFSMEFLRTPTGGAFCGYNFDRGVHLMLCDP